MGAGNKIFRKLTSWLVLISFLTSLMAPAVQAAALIPVKVPGRQVLFDLNTATVQELASIPGIGPKTASEIVQYRTQFGPFKTVQDLAVVRGVGKARLSKLVTAAGQGSRPDLRLRGGRPSVQQPVPAQAPTVQKALPAAPKQLALPAPKKTLALPAPPAEVWVTGSNGTRVNVNVANTKALVTSLVRAGFSNQQVNIIANTRLVGQGQTLTFKPFQNLAELQTRLISVGGKGIIDGTGAQIAPKVQAPAAPVSEPTVKPVPGASSKALVYNAGDRLMFRFDAGGKAVTVNLNQTSATGLYKQLREAGVSAPTAKAVAEARIKGSFSSFADLTGRVPAMETLSKAAATQRSAAPAPSKPQPAKASVLGQSQPVAPGVEFEAAVTKLTDQHTAIAKRTPTSVTGYDRTIKSLQDTYNEMFKSLAQKAVAEGKAVTPSDLAKDARLERIARDIDTYGRNKANLVKSENLNRAKVSLDGEISKYSKQAEAVMGRTPTSVKGFDTTLDSLKATYKDLYSRLEMRARLEGKSVAPESLVKDSRLQKLSASIDSMRTARSEFQTHKAANVEQAQANRAKAAARETVAQKPAAPAETPAPAPEPAVSKAVVEEAPAFKSRTDYTTRIDNLSSRAKQLFTEIKAESGGRFTTNREVWDAAKSYKGEGKLAELAKVGTDIHNLRARRAKASPAEQVQAGKPVPAESPAPAAKQTEPVAPKKVAKATAQAPVQEAPAAPSAQTEPVAAKPLTEVQQLSQQAKALSSKLLKSGQFTNPQEVFKASEAPGAKGELAQLKGINDQIRGLRAANRGAPVETAPKPAASELGAAETAVKPAGSGATPETGATKTSWTDGFLKAFKGGTYRSTDGGWADSYLKVLKGEGLQTNAPVKTAEVPTRGPAPEVIAPEAAASELGAPSTPKPVKSGGWAEQYLSILKGEAPGGSTAGTPTQKTSWWKKLFSRGNVAKTAPVEAPVTETPVTETPMTETRIAELPTEGVASETAAGKPIKASDVKAQIKDLQGQAYSLRTKLKTTGKFANNAEIYKASEAQGASGDLAALKQINDQIRTLRASKTGATAPVAETPAVKTEGTVAAPEGQTAGQNTASQPKPTAKGNAFMDWLTGKNSIGGKALADAKAQQAGETPVKAPEGSSSSSKGGLMDWLTGKGGNTAKPTQAESPAPSISEPTGGKANVTEATGKPAANVAESPAMGRNANVAEAPTPSVAEPVGPPKGSATIAELPVEAPGSAPSPQTQKLQAIETKVANLRTQAHDISANLVKEGSFTNAAEVAKAAEAPTATGKLAEIQNLNQNIKALNVEKAAVASTPQEGTAGAPVNAAAGKGLAEVAGAAGSETGFSVKFGNKVQDLGRMTASQIEAETGGLVGKEAATKIADAAAANGGKLSTQDLGKLGLTDDVVATLKKGNTEAVSSQLKDARAKAVEKFGADSEVVKKIDSNLEQLKGNPSEPKSSETRSAGYQTDVLTARQTQLDAVNAQIAKVEGKGGLLAKFTKGKQLKALQKQKASLEQEISQLKSDPKALESANQAYQQKNQKVFAEQGRQVGVLEAELAKVDPNSRYGRALQERISQIKSTPPESFAKQATNMFLIAAGTNIMLNLARQIKNGEKLDLGAAVKSIATPQFLLGTAGAAIGAYAGTKFAVSKLGLILTTKLGSFLPPVGRVFLQMLPAMAGGALGSTLLGGGFKNADWLEIGAETIGSTLGTAIAATMFPGFGLFGQIGAGMMGAEAAKFVLKMIRGDPKSEAGTEGEGASGGTQTPEADASKASATIANFTEKDVEDAFQAMSIYYQRYVQFEKEGNYGDAAVAYEKYAALKARLDAMRNASFEARAK